jgi:hypothetical protein
MSSPKIKLGKEDQRGNAISQLRLISHVLMFMIFSLIPSQFKRHIANNCDVTTYLFMIIFTLSKKVKMTNKILLL